MARAEEDGTRCARSAVAAEWPARRQPRPRGRTRIHHWFHKGVGYRPGKVCRTVGFLPLQWPTDGGCADAGFARARASFPVGEHYRPKCGAIQISVRRKNFPPKFLPQEAPHLRVLIDNAGRRGRRRKALRPAPGGDVQKVDLPVEMPPVIPMTAQGFDIKGRFIRETMPFRQPSRPQ